MVLYYIYVKINLCSFFINLRRGQLSEFFTKVTKINVFKLKKFKGMILTHLAVRDSTGIITVLKIIHGHMKGAPPDLLLTNMGKDSLGQHLKSGSIFNSKQASKSPWGATRSK